jgi:hypothetical protein
VTRAQVFIKLPQARGAGKVLYKDETLHPNTLLFLDDLRRNNDRQWLKFHDPDYRQSQKDFHCFIEKLTERLVDKDETLPELPTKDIGMCSCVSCARRYSQLITTVLMLVPAASWARNIFSIVEGINLLTCHYFSFQNISRCEI